MRIGARGSVSSLAVGVRNTISWSSEEALVTAPPVEQAQGNHCCFLLKTNLITSYSFGYKCQALILSTEKREYAFGHALYTSHSFLCSHKLLNILLLEFAKYVSTCRPCLPAGRVGSAIFLLKNYACAFTKTKKTGAVQSS
jgi:hypothetical protein